jgi:cytochrome c-type biogenesis protein CcmH/NrfG
LGGLAAIALLMAAGFYSKRLWRPEAAPEPIQQPVLPTEIKPEPVLPGVADLPALPALPTKSEAPPATAAAPPNAAKADVKQPPTALRAEASSSPPATVQAAAEEMQHVVQRLLVDFPEHPEALDLTARARLLFGQSSGAAECWKKTLEVNSNDVRAYRGLASIARIRNDPQEQLRLLRKALSIDLRSFDTHFDLAKAMVDQGQNKEAVKLLEAHLQFYPGSPRSYSLLGAAYLQDNAFKEAKQAYLAAVKLEPRDEFPYLGLAKACARLGDQEASNRYQQKYEELHRGNRQNLRSRRGSYEDLTAQCDTLSNISTQAGRVYWTQQNYREAERLWRRAAAVTSTHVDSRKALRDLFLSKERTAELVPILEQLVQLVPAEASYCAELGRLYAESGRMENAEAAFLQACQRDPKKAASHAALAELYVKAEKKLSDAAALARKAAELEPSAAHYWLLATASRRHGDVPAALAALDKALELDPGNLQYREAQREWKEKK